MKCIDSRCVFLDKIPIQGNSFQIREQDKVMARDLNETDVSNMLRENLKEQS